MSVVGEGRPQNNGHCPPCTLNPTMCVLLMLVRVSCADASITDDALQYAYGIIDNELANNVDCDLSACELRSYKQMVVADVCVSAQTRCQRRSARSTEH